MGEGAIDAQELLALVQRLIRFKSVNQPGDVVAITDYIEGLCRSWGLNPERIAKDPTKPNLIMSLGSGSGPTIVMYGHTDVVPIAPDEATEWVCDPFAGEIRGDRLYGRGAIDSKGTLSSMLLAAKALVPLQHKLNGKVVIMVVSDGEVGDQAGLKYLAEVNRLSGDMVIGCEPSNMKIIRAYKGRIWLQIKVLGQTRHALADNASDNAIMAMNTLLAGLKDLELVPPGVPATSPEILGGASQTVTTINGGTAVNVSPGECNATVDLRMMPGDSVAAVMERFDRLIKRIGLQGWEISATPIPGSFREPLMLPDDSPIVRVMQQAMSAVGLQPEFGKGYSSGGVGNFLAMGIPGVYYGPGSIEDAHHANESALISDIVKTSNVYYQAALAACGLVANAT